MDPGPATDGALAPFSLEPDAVRVAAPDFVSVYREHFAFVWRSLRRLGVTEHALDDAAQEVFITVHRRLPEFEGRSSIKTWIFGILRNIARHHRRGVARRREGDPIPETTVDPNPVGPLESAARAQAVAALHEFLEGLDDTLRECFILSELEQMTAPEVATATGANLHTVHSRIRTARQQFEQMVSRRRARDPWSRP
jgi:RNA polymerase sigma-70 factor, ECF subfamily